MYNLVLVFSTFFVFKMHLVKRIELMCGSMLHFFALFNIQSEMLQGANAIITQLQDC